MLTTNELTVGERLRVARRREGLTQAQMAEDLGIPFNTYRRIEDDTETGWTLPSMPLGKLQEHEIYAVLRRRERMTLDDLADRVGLSKWWLCQIERGKVPASEQLVDYWA